jgi:hypothetical protein
MKGTIIAMVVLIALFAGTACAQKSVQELTAARMPDSAREAQEPVLRSVAIGEAGSSVRERNRLTTNVAYPGAPSADDLGFRDPPCELECDPCAYTEGEEPCYDGYVDVFNSGCNNPAESFSHIDPAYGRITMCGLSGTYVSGGNSYRDTDWYEIVLTESREIEFCCTAEFPLQMFIIDGILGCSDYDVLENLPVDECTEGCITITIGPGTFWLWVGPQVFEGLACDLDYIMTIDGYYADDCVLDCPGGAEIEGEPECGPGYVDHFNGGCNSHPEVFSSLVPSASTIWVCGKSGVHSSPGGLCYRDTDWYEIVLDEPREIEFCAAAEFPVQTFLIVPDPDCTNPVIIDEQFGGSCEDICMTQVLDPGTYWLWIGPSYWLPTDCDRRYIMTVSGYTTPVERTSWGMIKGLYR